MHICTYVQYTIIHIHLYVLICILYMDVFWLDGFDRNYRLNLSESFDISEIPTPRLRFSDKIKIHMFD